ncbi:MAG: NifB/NifX family molybdenum-iron cluster-binding protein [Candidatus Baldrarchaeia archaeon]
MPRILIPTEAPGGLDAPVSQHFGRAETFTIVDVEDGKIVHVEVVDNRGMHFGGGGRAVQVALSVGADIVISRGLGIRALFFLKNMGITVLTGNFNTVREAISAYLRGDLRSMEEEDVCMGGHHRSGFCDRGFPPFPY